MRYGVLSITAILPLLAEADMFVPCKEAEVGLWPRSA